MHTPLIRKHRADVVLEVGAIDACPMVERLSCSGKIGCKLKTKGRHSRPSPYSLPLCFSCKEAALYLGRFFSSTPACIGINSDLGLSSRPPPCNRLWAQAARLPHLRFLRGRCGSAAIEHGIDHGRRPGSNFSHRRQAGVLVTHGGGRAAAAVRRRSRTPLSAAATGRGAINFCCVAIANADRCHRH